MIRADWTYPLGDLRVSDADRDRALCELSEAFQAGRITADEFDQRSGHALAARTGNELTALLADLPVQEAPGRPTADLDRARRLPATRIALAASVAAICFAGAAAAAAAPAVLSIGPTLQQRQFIGAMAASRGLPPPPVPPNPGFDWAGTITPGAIAVLLVVLIICLRVRLARADRP